MPHNHAESKRQLTEQAITRLPNSEDVNQTCRTDRIFGDSPNLTDTHRIGSASVEREKSQEEKNQELQAIYFAERQAGKAVSLEFAPFLAFAFAEVYGRRRTLEAARRWESPLFHLVRLVKSHAEMEGLDGPDAFSWVEKIMDGWRWSMPKEKQKWGDCWLHWIQVLREDAHTEFLKAWDKIRYLPGQGPLNNAHALADVDPLTLDPMIARKRSDGYGDFISLAGWLQVTVGAKPILLPVETVGELLGVQPMTVSRYRSWAVEDCYLRQVRAAEYKGKGKKGKATEFVFNVSLFALLRDRAEKGTVELFHPTPAK